jgi:hypothetical protein
MQADVWAAWGAIAALIASGVALAVATAPLIWRRRHHPTLDLTVELRKPWVRVPYFDDKRTYSVWFRAEVVNSGHAEARNVRAVVLDWYARPDSDAGWTRIDLDPSALHWVSLPWGHRWHDPHTLEERETAPVVNLPPGLSDLVDLISYNWEKGDHSLVLDYDRPRGFLLKLPDPEAASRAS